MAGKSKGVFFYGDYKEHLELLSDEERGRLVMALFAYVEVSMAM